LVYISPLYDLISKFIINIYGFQDLSIVVSSEHEHDAIEIVEDEDEISAVNVLCFVDDTEWTIRDLVYSEPRYVRMDTG